MSKVINQMGPPRDWPPLFPDDIKRIQIALMAIGVDLTASEAQSFWEEISDPDGWRSPVDDEEVTDAYRRCFPD